MRISDWSSDVCSSDLWVRRRRALHRPEVLAALAADLAGLAPDHLVVTGDLTNIALPGEFVQVGRWLEGLGAPEGVTVVPGNHDAYVAVPWERSLAEWTAFMACEERAAAAEDRKSTPLNSSHYCPYRMPSSA